MEIPDLCVDLEVLEPEEKVRMAALQLSLWLYRNTTVKPSDIVGAADLFETYVFNYQDEPPTDGGTEIEVEKPKLEVIEGGKQEKWFSIGSK
jgi:hypothetical protein